MASIAKSINLKEITIENNPISLAGDCVSFLCSYLPLLNSLNQLQITEQVRRAANAWRKSKENTDQSFQHLSTDVSSSIRREEIISNARTNWELIRQANIINGTQRQAAVAVAAAKKPAKTPKLTQNNSSSSTSTTSSLNVNMQNGKARNTSRQMIDVTKRQAPRRMRSSSAENSSPIVSEKETDGESEYFHLPPVLGQLSEPQIKSNQSAASSTRPNFDSESSAFSSDTDDHRNFKSQVPTTPPIHTTVVSKPPSPIEIIIRDEDVNIECLTPPLPPLCLTPTPPGNLANESAPRAIKRDEPVPTPSPPPPDAPTLPTRLVTPLREKDKEQPKATLSIVDSSSGFSLQPTTRNLELETTKVKAAPEAKSEHVEVDKLSVNSKSSAKTSSESINTLLSANEERQVHSSHTSHHPRGRGGARKAGAPLIRSQTARNLSSHLNNQQSAANNPSGNQKKEAKKETDKDREQGEGESFLLTFFPFLVTFDFLSPRFHSNRWRLLGRNSRPIPQRLR